MIARWKVKQSESGLSLLQFIKTKISLSGRKLKQLIEANQCRVNGSVERFASIRMRSGDSVDFNSIESGQLPMTIDEGRILYEDDTLFVYNKPSGIASDENGLCALFPNYYPVHRLDKETSGVIVFAKTKKKKQELEKLFHDREVKKVYLALVDGSLKKSKGTVNAAIGRLDHKEGYALWGIVPKEKGRSAITEWETERRGPNASLVRCYPMTGRTHQIRLHMKKLGHPILGDYRYERNYRCAKTPKRVMLHALEIEFGSHKIKAPIPIDFKEMMEEIL